VAAPTEEISGLLEQGPGKLGQINPVRAGPEIRTTIDGVFAFTVAQLVLGARVDLWHYYRPLLAKPVT